MKNYKYIVGILFFLLISFFSIYSIRNFIFSDTSLKQSLTIFTQIAMQDNFSDASLIGLGNPKTVSLWRNNYKLVNGEYFSNEFKNTLSKEKINQLLDAELKMNRKRKIIISDIVINNNSATAKISISKVNYSQLVNQAIEKTNEQKKANNFTTQEISERLADNLIDAFNNAKISNDMASFNVNCKKVIISNVPKDTHMKMNKLDSFFLFLMSHIAGHCWYPEDTDNYFYKLDQVIEQ